MSCSPVWNCACWQRMRGEHNFPPPKTLQAAILLVAILGGYQRPKKGSPAGHKVMWRGYIRLMTASTHRAIWEKHELPPIQKE